MEDDDAKLFQRIINLRVGEGLIFCPSAIVPSAFLEGSLSVDGDLVGTGDGDGCSGASANQNEKLGGRFLRIKVRRRLTADVSAPESSLRNGRLLTAMTTGWKVDCLGVIERRLIGYGFFVCGIAFVFYFLFGRLYTRWQDQDGRLGRRIRKMCDVLSALLSALFLRLQSGG